MLFWLKAACVLLFCAQGGPVFSASNTINANGGTLGSRNVIVAGTKPSLFYMMHFRCI